MSTQADPIVHEQILAYLDSFQELFCTGVSRALQETKFANRMHIAPRRLEELSRREVAAFQHFIRQRNAQEVAEHGKQLALEGLGHSSIIHVTAALRKVWLNVPTAQPTSFPAFLTVTDEYVGSLLEGYIDGCEQEVRREQQLTQAAYLRSLEHGTDHADSDPR